MLISKRLKLVPLSHQELQILQESRFDLEISKGWNISEQIIEPDYLKELEGAFPFWIEQTAANPKDYLWFTAWEIILTAENLSIGGIGLMGLPNEAGETMTGYHIDGKFQKQGFASEALECLLRWAFQNPDLKAVIAHTLPENPASQKVLEKNKFEKIGEDLDEGRMVLQWKLTRN
ncbi:MAG: N-acetyltransferase [Bacteroidetes bacterium]|nr:MAG: N-acetyltransferase [Bacteroidota bacterium]